MAFGKLDYSPSVMMDLLCTQKLRSINNFLFELQFKFISELGNVFLLFQFRLFAEMWKVLMEFKYAPRM